MLTLSLLRHAKSKWGNPHLTDHERPLSKRGTRNAEEVGLYIARNSSLPELILSSDAERARATVSRILAELDTPPEVIYDNELYLASPGILLERLRKVGSGRKHIMLVGHNPGLHALALTLTGSGDPDIRQEMAMKFPTAALAIISFDDEDWSAIKPASGTLQAFITPRELA